MKRALILVEGQTEERFVKDVLAPAFEDRELYFCPTILVTKRAKRGQRFKGGISTYGKFKGDLQRLIGGSGGALVTTLVDFYGLPNDFPGISTIPSNANARARVAHVQDAVLNDLGSPRLVLPFIALHEFEAWLFSSPSLLAKTLAQPNLEPEITKEMLGFLSPEDINERPNLVPSKRIGRLFPAYQKVLHGPTVVERIGLDAIAAKCPHFDGWLKALDAYAKS